MKIYVGEFEIPVIRKNIKRLRMRILPRTGEPEISAPLSVSIAEIENFAQAHRDWIQKHSLKVKAREAVRSAHRQLNDGDRVKLWGDEYPLRVLENAKRATATFDGKTITLKLPANTDIDKKNKTLHKLYARELADFIDEILPHWEKTMKESPTEIKYRNMKTKWGSCKPSTGVVTLNTLLASFHEDYAEMVLVHELVHFKEIYHNQRFKNYMTKYLPGWKELQKQLKGSDF